MAMGRTYRKLTLMSDWRAQWKTLTTEMAEYGLLSEKKKSMLVPLGALAKS